MSTKKRRRKQQCIQQQGECNVLIGQEKKRMPYELIRGFGLQTADQNRIKSRFEYNYYKRYYN